VFCADTSSWIAYFGGESGWDVDLLDRGLHTESVVMAPVVLLEMFSDPAIETAVQEHLRSLPLLETTPGYWERAGMTRALLCRHRSRPKLADTLIAQSCLDYKIPLLTRDRDFLVFARHADLQLVQQR
jgi:predicted nucleic acid-binding protein